MALTELWSNQGIVGMGVQSRMRKWGMYTFTTTSLTGTIAVPMRQVELVTPYLFGAGNGNSRTMSQMVSVSASATTAITFVSPVAGTITAASVITSANITGDNTNYWTFGLVDQTTSTTPVDSTTAANQLKTGNNTAPYVPYPLTLGTGANVAVYAGDVLEFTATKSSSPNPLTELSIELVISDPLAGTETVYWADTLNADNKFIVGSTGKISIARSGNNVLSGRKIMVDIWGIG